VIRPKSCKFGGSDLVDFLRIEAVSGGGKFPVTLTHDVVTGISARDNYVEAQEQIIKVVIVA
jgi:hypothetical protein